MAQGIYFRYIWVCAGHRTKHVPERVPGYKKGQLRVVKPLHCSGQTFLDVIVYYTCFKNVCSGNRKSETSREKGLS